MAKVGFIHPVSRGRGGFEMFENDTLRLGRPGAPPWLAEFVRRKEASDVRHATLDLTATRCLGCPRQTFIETLLPWSDDIGSSWTMHRGSALHEIAAQNWPENYISEATHRGLLTVKGELFGTTLSAQCDAARFERLDDGDAEPGAHQIRVVEIVDLKFPNDWSVKWRGKPFPDERQQWIEANGSVPQPCPKLDHAVQLNIIRLLMAQQGWAQEAGYDAGTVLLTLWDHASGQNEGPVAYPVPHLSEETMLRIRPGGGEATIKEIVDEFEAGRLRAEAAGGSGDKEELCASLPLIGKRGMWNGKKCAMYCGVQDVCESLDMRFGGTGR